MVISILKDLILIPVLFINLYYMSHLFLLGDLSLDSSEWFAMTNCIGLWACDGQKIILELFK